MPAELVSPWSLLTFHKRRRVGLGSVAAAAKAIDLSTVALIPARGGSKGIPGKNSQLVGGIPLLTRSIRAAQNAERVSRVFVSSDDPDLLNLAEAEGATAIVRPAKLAGDMASSEAALLHALTWLAARDCQPELFVFLQCTSPFTRGDQIDRVVQTLLNSQAAMAFAATPWHGFIWQTNADGWGEGVNHNADVPRARRQDLAPCWLESGAIYAIRRRQFQAAGNRFVAPRLPVPIEDWAPEIDSPRDLLICRQLSHLLDRPMDDSSASVAIP